MPKNKDIVELEVPSKVLRIQNAGCPNGHSLMDEDHLINGYPSVAVLARYRDETGLIHLDPIYGSFKNISQITVPDGELVEFLCPTCKVSLQDADQRCSVCSAPMFAMQLPKGGIVEGCLRNGCQFHSLKLVSSDELVKRLYESHSLDSYL
ncbi:MAG TPA: hypothetical protein PKI81_11845 [bacterium]|jgi:hypothetical protein|nr:hypothetical protein [bacterium]HOC89085.1 hypothetical protein [bacterium]